MAGPINYGEYLTQIDLRPLVQAGQNIEQRKQFGIAADQDQQKIDLATQAAQAKTQQEAAWGEAVRLATTEPTTANLTALYQFPDKIQAATALHNQYTEGQQRRNLTAATTVGGLINAGQTNQALSVLRERRSALGEAGETSEVTDALIGALEKGTPEALNQAKGLAGVYITMATGDPEKSGPLLDRLGYSSTYQLDERRQNETERHNRVTEGQGDARVDLSAAAGARAAAKASGKGGGSGGGGSGSYEYRIGPDGKLQRRKR